MSPASTVTVDALPSRPVQRADLLLALRVGAPDLTVVVRDADTGEFAAVPGLPADPDMRPLAVAPAGDRVLLLAEHDGNRYGGLCLHTLASGEQRWLSARAEGQAWLAGISPDGRTLATLTTGHDWAAVDVIGIATGRRRRLASVPDAGYSAESCVCWSPDGQLIAVTYLAAETADADEDVATIVVRTDGTVLAHHQFLGVLSGSNGAWATERTLVCQDPAQGDLSLLDVEGNTTRSLGPVNPPPLALLDGRLVQKLPWAQGAPTRLVTLALDGGDQQPFLTIDPDCSIELLGCVPG
jgi:hypothetical protein